MRSGVSLLAGLLSLTLGAGSGAGEAPAPAPTTGERILSRAHRALKLGRLRPLTKQYPDDCSGLVRFAYAAAGIDLVGSAGKKGDNAVTTIFKRAGKVGALVSGESPRPGDLVFFRDTYDRNRDGHRNDGLTHVGIVEAVAPDGTITFIHRGLVGVARGRMNLRVPSARHGADGGVLNDYVSTTRGAHAPVPAGQLFVGFASYDAPW